MHEISDMQFGKIYFVAGIGRKAVIGHSLFEILWELDTVWRWKFNL